MLAHWEQYLTHSKCPLNTWMNDWMNTKMCKPRYVHPKSNLYEALMLPLIEVLETVNRDPFPWEQWITLRWIAFRFQNASLLTFGIFEWHYIINSSQRSICSARKLKSKIRFSSSKSSLKMEEEMTRGHGDFSSYTERFGKQPPKYF